MRFGKPFLPTLGTFFREIRSSERCTIVRWCHPDDPPEHPTEVALALKPARQRHLKDRSGVIPQQMFRTLDSLLNHVTMWTRPHTLAKEEGKVVWTHACGSG